MSRAHLAGSLISRSSDPRTVECFNLTSRVCACLHSWGIITVSTEPWIPFAPALSCLMHKKRVGFLAPSSQTAHLSFISSSERIMTGCGWAVFKKRHFPLTCRAKDVWFREESNVPLLPVCSSRVLWLEQDDGLIARLVCWTPSFLIYMHHKRESTPSTWSTRQ